MDTQKLHDLIDKVIGKDGPLRTPAYWMRRVLRSLVEYAHSIAISVKEYADAQIEDISNAINRLGVQVYEYQDLLKIADAGQLERGKKYIVKYYPYIRTTSTSYSQGIGLPYGEVLLTAASETDFLEDAVLYRSGVTISVKYVFRKDPERFNWCPYLVEHRFFSDEYGKTYQIVTDPKYYTAAPTHIVYSSYDSGWKYYKVDNKETDPYNVSLLNLEDLSFFKRVKVRITDSDSNFSGLIYEYHDLKENMHLPFDPYFTWDFSVLDAKGNPWISTGSSLSNCAGNITIRPFLQNGVYWLPYIRIIGTEPAKGVRQHVFIDEGCYNIILHLYERESIYIGAGCSNILIKDSATVNIPAHSTDVTLKGCSAKTSFDGALNKVYIESVERESYLNIKGGYYLSISGEDNQNTNVILLPSLYRQGELTTVNLYSLFHSATGTYYVQVGTDGTVKAWPAGKTTTSAVIDEATGKTLDTILSETGGGSGSVLLELEFEGNSSMDPLVLEALMEGLNYNKTVITFLGKIWEPYLDLNAHKIVLTCLRKQPDDDYIVRETYTVDIETRDVDWKEEKAEREEIKVIEVPDKWNDGSIYDLEVSAEEYFATPVIIFKVRGPGAVGYLYARKKNSTYTGDVYNYGVWTDTYEILLNDITFVLNVTYDETENQGDPNAHMKVQLVG